MKKVVMTMGAFFALSVATAQGGYVSFSAGYAGGTGSVIGYSHEQVTSSLSNESIITGTFGKGIPINLAGGFMFSEHFGAELGATYFLGTKVISEEWTYLNDDYEMTSSKSSQLRIIPQLIVSSGSAKALEVYGKAGLLLPVVGSVKFKQESQNGSNYSATEGTIKGKFNLGYTGAIGAAYSFSDKLSVFAELQGVTLNIKRRTRTITSNTINGTEFIDGTTPVVATETEYVNELGSGDNLPQVAPGHPDYEAYASTPRKAITSSTNYSSVGINLGIKFKF